MAYVRRIPNRKVWIACFIDKDGNRKSKTTGTRNRKEAEKIAEQYETIAKGRATFATIQKAMSELCKEYTGEALPSHTVREYWEIMLSRKKPTVAPSTFQKYLDAFKSLEIGLGEKAESPLSNITTTHLEKWREIELERVSPNTLQTYTKIVRGLFRAAQNEGLRTDNPAASLGALKKDKSIRKEFTPEQVRDLLRIAPPEWKSLILFALYTGQRLGDLAALTWEAVDTEKGLITITTQKTGTELHIPIAAPLLRHIASLPVPKKNSSPIHPEAAGKSIQLLSSKEFVSLLVQAGIREQVERTRGRDPEKKSHKRTRNPLSFHSFRHTAVSFMKSAGIGESIVMDLIGHDSEATSRGYTHLDLESKRAALATIPDLLEEV